MDFELNPEQQALRDAVREVAGRFDDHYWADRNQRHEVPWEFHEAFAEAGWLGIAIPETYGGGGLGITEAALPLEEVAALCGCGPVTPSPAHRTSSTGTPPPPTPS